MAELSELPVVDGHQQDSGAAQLADEQSQQLLDQLDAGTAIQTLATEAGPVLHEAEAVARNAPGHSPELVRQVFKMPRPESGAGINRKIALSNGDHAVVQLTAVNDADPAAMTDAQRIQLQRGFENLHLTKKNSLFKKKLVQR